MTLKESFVRIRDWSSIHQGLISLIIGLGLMVMSFIQANRYHNQLMIQEYQMSVIEQKLLKTEELERERIAYSMSVSRDLKEIKGYVQGVSDKQMQKFVERMPVEFKWGFMSKAACKEIIDSGAKAKMIVECLQWQAVVNPTDATEAELDEIREYYDKVIAKGERLMAKLNPE